MKKYLLDTHTLIWFLEGDSQISPLAKSLVLDIDNQLFVSMASLWEMAIKTSIGKLTLTQPLEEIIKRLPLEFMELLPIEVPHVLAIQNLPFHHKDPFDRILIAQTITENIEIISIETIFDQYGIKRVW
jgi:PIN domain nuclease of toxin-antitoxin system